jgi:prepilin-type processing-associated H-X9-DG protein/prepilin-type N-terminal cleavage/methylation domain-containing protein
MLKTEPHRRPRPAFTLVELLVVVGIIALLIALLMPALSGARDAANRAKCLATLRSMQQAAHMHTLEHHGYMPVGGHQGPSQLGVSATDVGLRDPGRRHYFYYYDGEARRPDPLPISLGHYMGLRRVIEDSGTVFYDRVMATSEFRKFFTCPGEDQDSAYPGYTLTDSTPVQRSRAYMSYIFNGALLGRQLGPWGETPAGRLAAVRQPTTVFLFADGNSGSGGSPGVFGVAAYESTQDRLYDALRNRKRLDFARHRGRINVMFVDGHAETLMLPARNFVPDEPKGDLGRVGLTKGIFD